MIRIRVFKDTLTAGTAAGLLGDAKSSVALALGVLVTNGHCRDGGAAL